MVHRVSTDANNSVHRAALARVILDASITVKTDALDVLEIVSLVALDAMQRVLQTAERIAVPIVKVIVKLIALDHVALIV